MNMKRNKWRMILDIARTELQTLFYSPIAWLTLIIFVVQASMTFSSVFGTYVERFNLGYRPVNLTQGIFPVSEACTPQYYPICFITSRFSRWD